MAKRNRELKFEFKATTLMYATNQVNQVTVTINVDGTVERYGRVLGTLSCGTPERKNGVWHWCGVSYPVTGISMSSNGHGKFEKLTPATWRTHGMVTISDGHLSEIEAVLDLATHAWVGKLTEQN